MTSDLAPDIDTSVQPPQPCASPPDGLVVRIRPHDGGVVVRLGGDLDIATAPLLDTQLSLLPSKACDLVFDATELGFLDCAGLRVILGARVDGEGRSVLLRNPLPHVKRMLTILGLDHLIEPEAR